MVSNLQALEPLELPHFLCLFRRHAVPSVTDTQPVRQTPIHVLTQHKCTFLEAASSTDVTERPSAESILGPPAAHSTLTVPTLLVSTATYGCPWHQGHQLVSWGLSRARTRSGIFGYFVLFLLTHCETGK